MAAKFRSQVFGFLDILGESWNIYKLGFKDIFLISLVVYLPYSIFLYFYPTGSSFGLEETSAVAVSLSCIYSLVQVAIGLIAYIAVAYLVEQIVQGQRTSWTAVLRYTFSKLPIVLVIDLCISIILVVGFLLLIIPGIIIGIYLVFTPIVVALRKINFQAFQYSIDLVKGQWWRVFGIAFGIGFITFAFNYFLSWVLPKSAPFIGFGTVFINLIGYLVTILFAIYLVVFFLNQDYLKHPLETEPANPRAALERQDALL